MIRRSAADHVNAPQLFYLFFCHAQLFQHNLTIFDSWRDRILNCLGLLIDLFEHKVLISALFGRLCVPLDRCAFFFDRLFIQVIETDMVRLHAHNLHIVDEVDRLCVFQNGRDVRCDEIALLCASHNHRAVFSDCEHFSGMILK